jgi:hypothetical protein
LFTTNNGDVVFSGALVQRFGGFKWPSVIMGALILTVGFMILALRWIAAAQKVRVQRSRSSGMLSLPSGISSPPSGEDLEDGGHPSQVAMLDADRNGGMMSRPAGRVGHGQSKE